MLDPIQHDLIQHDPNQHDPNQHDVVALTGRLDIHVAADVRLALADAVDNGSGELVLDLTELVAVDATGLGVLVGAHRRAQRAGRTLVLEAVPDTVGRLLLVTRLDKVLSTRRAQAS